MIKRIRINKLFSNKLLRMFTNKNKTEFINKNIHKLNEHMQKESKFKGNNYGEIIFENGNYRGMMKNGLMHGYGEIDIKDQDYYNGEFFNNKYEGKGLFVDRRCKLYYKGEFKNGFMNGKGEVKYLDESTDLNFVNKLTDDELEKKLNKYSLHYIGDFKNDLFDGYGEYTTDCGVIIKGYHKDGKIYKGEKIDGDSYYSGEIKNSKMHGKGVLKSPEGRKLTNIKISEDLYKIFGDKYSVIYTGEFINDIFNGLGELKLYFGDIYTGNFKNGLFNGLGEYTKYLKYFYKGEFKNGLKDGRGEYYFPNGYYRGEFKKGFMHGKGEYKNNDDVYIGEFKDLSKYEYPNEKDFNLYFKNDKLEGKWEIIVESYGLHNIKFTKCK